MTLRIRVERLWTAFTPAGKLLTGACIITGAIGSLSIEIPLYHVFTALSGLWGVGVVCAVLWNPKVHVTAIVPHHATAGDAVSLPCTVVNPGRRTAFRLMLGLGQPVSGIETTRSGASGTLRKGERSTVVLNLTAVRRGRYGPLRLGAWSLFPFGLLRLPRGHTNAQYLLVYPWFHPLNSVELEAGRRLQPGGISLTSGTGESPEYIGNREYRTGDPVRRIDFRAWARLSRPAVREYQEEFFCRVALVLDTYIPKGPTAPAEGFANLEAAISVCASIADVLARTEYIIDLFAAGPELYVFRAGRNVAHFENVLEILSCLDACRDNPFETVTPALADELSRVSVLICVLLDWDAERAQLVQAALDAGCGAKVILVRDGGPSRPPDEEGVEIRQYSPADVKRGCIESL